MANEIVTLLKYHPNKNIRKCYCCDAENPSENEECFLCGLALNDNFSEEDSAVYNPDNPHTPQNGDSSYNPNDPPKMPPDLKHNTNKALIILSIILIATIVFSALVYFRLLRPQMGEHDYQDSEVEVEYYEDSGTDE